MPDYDASIRVSTRIDNSQLEKGTEKIQDELDKVEKKAEETKISVEWDDKAQREAEAQIDRILQKKAEAEKQKDISPGGEWNRNERPVDWNALASESQNVQRQMEDIAASFEKVPSQNSDPIREAQIECDKLIQKLESLYEKKKKLESLGVNRQSRQWKSLQYDIGKVESELYGVKKAADAFDVKNAGAGFDKAAKSGQKFFNVVRRGTEKSNGLLKTMMNRFKGIALSLLVFNWISKGFNAMVASLKEGFNNLVQYSSDYNASMSALKSSTAKLKNQLAAAFEPIANTVLPYLTAMVDWLTRAADAMARFLAALQGKSTYTVAKKQVIDYAKSLDKASDSAKRALASFDRLNVLNQKDGDTSPGGELTGADAFEEVEVSDAAVRKIDLIKAKLTEIKDLFISGFESGLGDTEDRFNTIGSSVENIKNKLKDLFSSPDVQNAAIEYTQSLIYTFGSLAGSFSGIGLSIAANLVGGISRYLTENADKIKKYLTNMFDIKTEINQLVVDYGEAFAYVSEAFAGENGQQLTANLIGILSSAFMGVTELAAKFGRDILHAIVQPFVDNKEELRTALDGFLGVLSEVAGTVKDGIDETFDHFSAVYDEKIKPFFDAMAEGLSDLGKSFLDWWNEDLQPVMENLARRFDEVWSGHIQPFLNRFGNFIGKVFDALKELWEYIQPIIKWVIDNILPVLTPILEAVGNAVLDLFGTISDVVGYILDALGGLIDVLLGTITGDWERAWEGIRDIFSGVANVIVGLFEFVVNSIIDFINGIIKGVNWVAGKVGFGDGVIPEMDNVDLPRLADGAVIQGGRPFAAILGDQRVGQTNIETPLATMIEAFKIAQAETGGGGEYTFIAQLDSKVIFKETVRQDRLERKATGHSAFLY